MNFSDLPTERFRLKMRPYAEVIYKQIFPGCEVEDLRENGVKVHILDKEFGIDSLINIPIGGYITIQEKYRNFDAYKRYREFTQEYKNAFGTPYESNGEWFSLASQLYFYGWANPNMDGFTEWFILNVAKYKLIVMQHGGLEKIGKLQQNNKHGRASFYGIEIEKIRDAIVYAGAEQFGLFDLEVGRCLASEP